MSDGIWAAVSGAVAQQRSLDVVANNVANANTTGYRADRVAFREALADAGTDGPAPDALRFVNISQIAADMHGGSLQQTNGTFDLALEGDGMFSLRTPQGDRYTRAGGFMTDAEGALRTPDGAAVLGRVGDRVEPIVVPPDATQIEIGRDGIIRADGQEVATLAIARFDQGDLEKEGATRFIGNGAAQPAEDIVVHQGFLEQSNLNAVAGMNELITVSRSFEAFQKIIDTFQQLDTRTARDLPKRG